MTSRKLFPWLAICCTLFFTLPATAGDPAELLPPSTVFYLELTDPAGAVRAVQEHALWREIQELQVYQAAVNRPQFNQFQAAVSFIESRLGMDWEEALATLTEGGVALAFDAQTEGVALLMQARDAESLEKIKSTLMQVTRDEAQRKGEDDPYQTAEYRGVTAYRTKESGFTTVGDWFVAANKGELGKDLIDALLDGRTDSLASTNRFQTAHASADDGRQAWFYANIGAIRESGAAQELFTGKANDFGAELILGGLLEAFQSTPLLTATLNADAQDGVVLRVSVPMSRDEISEERAHFFGPEGQGRALPFNDVAGRLLSVSVYRNISEMWLRAGDLFGERVNDQLAQADSTLSTLFSGKDFGEEILGSVKPQLQLLVSRQEFDESRPIPAIKLPAFALLAEMREPKTTGREFRRLFQSLIGFFNVVGASNDQPQLELDFHSLDEGELIAAHFVPEIDDEQSQQAVINFNFAPTLAVSGERLVIASAPSLAAQVLSAESPSNGQGDPVSNTSVEVVAGELQKVLADNREHLIAQNMLKEGHSREEAELEIDTLLQLLGLVHQAGIDLSTSAHSLDLTLSIGLTGSQDRNSGER